MMKKIVILTILLMVSGLAFLYSGIYPMGADDKHTAVTTWLLTTLRERSIAQASKDIKVPDLEDPEKLLMGGPDYNDMCAGCHLQPGVTSSDLSIGLYPAPPNLSVVHSLAGSHYTMNTTETNESTHEHDTDPLVQARRQYWIIKHGIKASGMPAWGPTHDDERIWAMVAFLQKLPSLTPDQYQILTARTEAQAHH